jgi:hypothetical protein
MNQRRCSIRVLALLALLALSTALLPGEAARADPQIAEQFRRYYERHEGIRVLGHPLSDLLELQGVPAQYFEKGRIEDHRGVVLDPVWGFMYGRLTAELMDSAPGLAVSGTSVTYGDLRRWSAETSGPAPNGFTGGTMPVQHGIFVPFHPTLQPAPGYIVPPFFWEYLNQRELFPAGWLHDVGLPMTYAGYAEVIKDGERRTLTVQAFERAVLTYDGLNPVGWRVERANIGADAVQVIGTPSTVALELPAPNQQVTLPIHILMHGDAPAARVSATLRWQDGTELHDSFTLLRGPDGLGLLVANLDWQNQLAPPTPRTQPATLELRRATGEVLARRHLVVLAPDDPQTQQVELYWTVSGAEVLTPQRRSVPRTPTVGAAALEELLWGPPTMSQVGFSTAIPTPAEVLAYPGREPDWGLRVTLRSLVIRDGVATADFSQELRAYGGGSLRVQQIRAQVERTLRQFPSVRAVRIAVEGQVEGELQP